MVFLEVMDLVFVLVVAVVAWSGLCIDPGISFCQDGNNGVNGNDKPNERETRSRERKTKEGSRK